MSGDRRRYCWIILWALLTTKLCPSKCEALDQLETKTYDVIDIISEKHIEIARCRLFCIKEFMGPRLLYPSLDAVSYDCQNSSISCHHCYEMCGKIVNEKEGMTICNYENHMCFGGCRTACKHRFLSSKNVIRPNIQDTNNVTKPEIEIKDCLVYWHFYTARLSEGNLVMYQLYGKDASGTWFDLGQTTQSFFENLSLIIDKTRTIRILAIDEQNSFKLEYILDEKISAKYCNAQKGNNTGQTLKSLSMQPLHHSTKEFTNENLSNFTVKVVIVLVLGGIFLFLTIILCVAIYRIKFKNGNHLNVSCATSSPEHSYEEIDVSDLNNLNFGIYNVKKGQITSLVNNNYSKHAFAVDLPKNQIFEIQNDHSNGQLKNDIKNSNFEKPWIDQGNVEGHSGSQQFMDVVSWLRSVHSEMRFDNLGYTDDEGELKLKYNVMQENTFI